MIGYLYRYGLILIVAAIVVLLLSNTTFAAYAHKLRHDTIAQSTPSAEKFAWEKIILPGSLITIGTVGVYSPWFRSIDRSLNYELTDLREGHRPGCDNYLQYLPVTSYATMGFIPGIKHRNAFAERLMAGVTAYGVMALLVNCTKYTVCEHRPNNGTHNSFPSGHTATAFTGAELIRLEYGNAVGVAGYAMAISVAFLRMYKSRHWLNDVIAGAGVGILSANIGYWLLPYERKLFKRGNICLIPYVSPDKQVGLALNIMY